VSVDLTLAKAQCRVTDTTEDALIEQYITSSRAWLERYTGLSFEEAEFTDTFTALDDYLQLSRGPFLALTTIAYTDADGTEQDLAASASNGRVYKPADGWPAILGNSTISVTYTAGFDAYNPLPEELVQAQLLLISHWFDNRGAVVVGQTSKELEYAVEALASPFRLPTVV
jgi:uncharacterized phiE125 gp8 family phage protein